MAMVITTQIQNNFCYDCEAPINNQIQLQLYAAYVYLSMAFYCDRKEVDLGHFSRFFLQQSHKWTQQSKKLLWIQEERGSHVSLNRIDKPKDHNWHGIFQVIEYAFNLEIAITESLLELYHLATRRRDAQLSNFLKHHCLPQQLETLEELDSFLMNLRKIWARRGLENLVK
ncbi:ferritin heavy chain-like [Perognathus longimembris pacificus]|uniref:ferritin heavy chain-like n=1 Tax=Perognathus longimembris pacificus TaxID=214514 RepID=UPI002019F28D|nr:ferritin heavy chain-like [Perognathus longimembris pacificus]